MKVVILCGGLGTRLREETDVKPKPMIQIGHRPILWHIMKIYSNYGFVEFVLCLGYKGELIKEYFYHYALVSNDVTIQLGHDRAMTIHNTGIQEDWMVTLLDTGERAFKGARLKRAEKYISGDMFLATYGDGVADVDIRALVSFHREHGKIATLTGVRPPSLFGELQVANGRVSFFVEKPQTSSGMINGGFFVFNREIFQYLSDVEDCDLERGPLEKLAIDGQLMVYEHRGDWACLDTYRDMEYLNQLWKANRAFWKVWQ